MIKRFKNWLIHKLGGKTKGEYKEVLDKWGDALDRFNKLLEIKEKQQRIAENSIAYHEGKYDKLRSQIKSAESRITIDARYGYTEDNVIEASKAQTMFNLGKAVYPYAEHFFSSDGVYIASVGVVDWEEKE